MLCKRGESADIVKVLDYGLIRELERPKDQEAVRVGSISGTHLYLSPEAVRSPGEVDPQSDLYQLGAVGYFLLTGEHVFSGANLREVCNHHLHSVPEPPSVRLGRAIAPDLERLLLSCLEKERGRRPSDATELRANLASCQGAGAWSQEWPHDDVQTDQARRDQFHQSWTPDSHPRKRTSEMACPQDAQRMIEHDNHDQAG